MNDLKYYFFIPTLIIFYGCQSLQTQNIAPGYIETIKAINNAVFGYKSDISIDAIQEIPYASMLLKIGKGPQGLLILESVNGNLLTWVSADGVYFVTEKGRIIKTEGLLNNLTDVLKGFSSLEDTVSHKESFEVYYSYNKPELRNLHLSLTYSVKGTEIIEIMGTSKELLLIHEAGESSLLGWKFINKYWVDDNFMVWKSIQTISPKLPKIETVLTKKPS